jgi:hypothetical protein
MTLPFSRLGVANTGYDANLFATQVLRLPANAPIYQQQLVHSRNQGSGPRVAAEWGCGGTTLDSTADLSTVIRQLSAHHHQFGRLNLKDSTADDFENYINNPIPGTSTYRSNQIFYLYNEPEGGSCKVSQTGALCTCFSPPSHPSDSNSPYVDVWQIDSSVSWCLSGVAVFEDGGYSVSTGATCTATSRCKRLKADVLAWLFLRQRDLANAVNRGHIVLPPCPSEGGFADRSYWGLFFDKVHKGSGIQFGACQKRDPISVASLRALHAHGYLPVANVWDY